MKNVHRYWIPVQTLIALMAPVSKTFYLILFCRGILPAGSGTSFTGLNRICETETGTSAGAGDLLEDGDVVVVGQGALRERGVAVARLEAAGTVASAAGADTATSGAARTLFAKFFFLQKKGI